MLRALRQAVAAGVHQHLLGDIHASTLPTQQPERRRAWLAGATDVEHTVCPTRRSATRSRARCERARIIVIRPAQPRRSCFAAIQEVRRRLGRLNHAVARRDLPGRRRAPQPRGAGSVREEDPEHRAPASRHVRRASRATMKPYTPPLVRRSLTAPAASRAHVVVEADARVLVAGRAAVAAYPPRPAIAGLSTSRRALPGKAPWRSRTPASPWQLTRQRRGEAAKRLSRRPDLRLATAATTACVVVRCSHRPPAGQGRRHRTRARSSA
jgi:hypothetical protein